VFLMEKATNIYVWIEPGLKEQAESVLAQLGIPVSNAVNIFMKSLERPIYD
jgi:DNA-damage-inducible protein J